jgi:HAD superfamily hydrolase (TIGR01509 family)
VGIADVKVISLDVFRTLVPVDESYKYVWSRFLGEKYTENVAQRNWDRATEILQENFQSAAQGTKKFKNIRTIFEETYTQLFGEIKLDFSPSVAAGVLMEGHRTDKYYDDVRPFLEMVGKKHTICLSTDCDTDMIANINALYPFDNVFVSEQLKVYKANPSFFTHVISHYGVRPENILHIGDAKSDVVTPKMLGMLTCWLNRNGSKWDHEIKPDFEVTSLIGVADILK